MIPKGYKTIMVCLDALIDPDTGVQPVFEAITKEGDEWNGWAVPLFNREQVERMVKHWTGSARAWAEGDRFHFEMLDWGERHFPEMETFEPVQVGGVPYWPIGSREWCWDVWEWEPEQVEAVAAKFSELLWEQVGEANMKTAIRNLSNPDYFGCCPTHDFIDSNMVMVEAVEDEIGNMPDIPQNPAHVDLVAKAWTLAIQKKYQFENSGE